MPKGISIHLGLNSVDPKGYGGWDGQLRACEADAQDMAKIAKDRGYAGTTLLLTKNATAAAFAKAMADAAEKLVAGDILFLSYSGHGGQVPDRDGDDEADGLDETWCLFDRQLLDDELYGLFGKFAKGVRIVLLSDSCHSGTVARNAELSGQTLGDLAAKLAASANALPQVKSGALKPFGGYSPGAARDHLRGLRPRPRPLREDPESQHQGAGQGRGRQDRRRHRPDLRLHGQPALLRRREQRPVHGHARDRLRRRRLRAGLPPLPPRDPRPDAPEQTPNLFLTGRTIPGFLAQQPFTI